jgi:ribosome biogenesis GTPase A
MVVGIPNVGKSTFINSFAGRACAKTGNKPGVTKGAQWVKLNKQVELLDTPGILWPRFEDQQVGMRLAMIGSVKDEVLNTEELAVELLKFLHQNYQGVIAERYHIEEAENAVDMLGRIAKERGCLLKGGELDLGKATAIFLEEFRNGKLGRITLELPSKEEISC